MKKLTLLIIIILLTIGCKAAPQKNDGSTASLVDYTEPPVIIVDDSTLDIQPPIIEPVLDSTPDTVIEQPPEITQVDPTPDVQLEPEPEPTPVSDTPPLEPDPTPDTPPPPPEPDPTPDVPPPPPIILPNFTVKIGEGLYFSDSDKMRLWKSGNIEKAGQRIYAVENDLITLDTNGNEILTTALITPLTNTTASAFRTKIKSTANGAYYCVEYPPALAFSLYGQSKTYSEIYKDNAVVSPWYLNKFKCAQILSVGLEVFALDTTGKYHIIDGVSTTVDYVLDDVFYRHGLNISGKYMYFNNSLELYNLNYALNANQWINYNGLNYSHNGYTWSADTWLAENATALYAWNITPYPVNPELPNAQAPVLLSAGVSEGKLYWIECNSGYVFEYDPVLDTLTQKWKIYLGDGMKDTGILKRGTLQPYIHGGKLYFSNDGAIYKLGLADGFINIFYGGSGVVEGF